MGFELFADLHVVVDASRVREGHAFALTVKATITQAKPASI